VARPRCFVPPEHLRMPHPSRLCLGGVLCLPFHDQRSRAVAAAPSRSLIYWVAYPGLTPGATFFRPSGPCIRGVFRFGAILTPTMWALVPWEPHPHGLRRGLRSTTPTRQGSPASPTLACWGGKPASLGTPVRPLRGLCCHCESPTPGLRGGLPSFGPLGLAIRGVWAVWS